MTSPAQRPAPPRDTDPQLPEHSRTAMLWLAQLLREGFTGRMSLECNNGTIRRVQLNQDWTPREGKMVCRGGGK